MCMLLTLRKYRIRVMRFKKSVDPGADQVGHDSVSIVPGVGILGVFGYLKYESWFALAEFVDNALQSAANSESVLKEVEPDYRLRVDISYERESGGRIVVDDNAGGIARGDFARAFRAADVPPDRTGLSEFGMGMKSAAIWFAKNWRVMTTSVGDPNVYTVEFDMKTVLRDQVERLHVSKHQTDPDTHFTRLELWNLNQFLPGRTMGKVRDHMREIYRVFLRDGRLALTVAGQEMEYSSPEILRAVDFRAGEVAGIRADPQEWRKPVAIELDDGVRVTGWAGIRAEGRTSGNGLSLFRRGRLVVGTSEAPYRPPSVYGRDNSYRSQRLFGELHVEGLPVSHTKDAFQWHGREEEFEDKLREVLDEEPMPLLKQAEGYRARQATRVEQQRVRAAGENTAEVAERNLPAALPQAVAETEVSPVRTLAEDPARVDVAPNEFGATFSFAHGEHAWTVSITAAERVAERQWLIRHVDANPKSRSIRAALTINTAHPFLKQFALGSTDALETVFRMAVALVVSESLLKSAGDGEVAAAFMRQVDTLLTEALSKRLRSDI